MPIRRSGKRKQNQGLRLNAKQQREALHLWRNSGMSVEAIGAWLGVNIDAIFALVERELESGSGICAGSSGYPLWRLRPWTASAMPDTLP